MAAVEHGERTHESGALVKDLDPTADKDKLFDMHGASHATQVSILTKVNVMRRKGFDASRFPATRGEGGSEDGDTRRDVWADFREENGAFPLKVMTCVYESWIIAGKPALPNQQKLIDMVDRAAVTQLSTSDPDETGKTLITTSAKLVLSHDRLGAVDYDLGACLEIGDPQFRVD